MKKYRIIIVEDDQDEMLFMTEGFETTNLFDVLETVSNGEELITWLRKNEKILPDLILSDLNMPGKNGYDIINYIKTHPDYSHIPVIIISTSAVTDNINKCLSLGAADYLVKPHTFTNYVPFAKNLHKLIDEKHLLE